MTRIHESPSDTPTPDDHDQTTGNRNDAITSPKRSTACLVVAIVFAIAAVFIEPVAVVLCALFLFAAMVFGGYRASLTGTGIRAG
jgi:hypothetical protein